MILRNTVVLLLCTAFLIHCGQEEPQDPRDAFFDNVTSLCGETFEGQGVFPDDPEHDLIDTPLRAHIASCDEEFIEINLYRGEDILHAIWVLEKREGGLHLYHDHAFDKEEDELEDTLTGYGGYADERGSATQQYFPADDHTAEILPPAATNVWMMELNLDEGQFIYSLERHDEPRFRAELWLN